MRRSWRSARARGLRWRDRTRRCVAGRRRRVPDSAGARRAVPAGSGRSAPPSISATVARHRPCRNRASCVGLRSPATMAQNNVQAGLPGDVADHERELEIHLHQRLLHPLDVRRGELDEGLSMPHAPVRSVTIAAVGRKLARSNPTLCRSRSHSASETSLFRPGRLRTCRAFTRWTTKPRASRIS